MARYPLHSFKRAIVSPELRSIKKNRASFDARQLEQCEIAQRVMSHAEASKDMIKHGSLEVRPLAQEC